ncbi:MAG: hypothetical protein H6732_11175 [Alphaproteobacteria bacterium]|nr:hypothetical protein [Alphaproteobacteria bacterium]
MAVLRNIGAVVAGLFLGSVANMAVIQLSWSLWPMPEGLDTSDYDALGAYISTLPTQAFLLVMVAHLLQAGLGGWVAARLGASRPRVLALVVAALTLLGGVANLLMLPAPVWMWVEVPLYLAVGWGVGTLELRRRER